ncbi:PPOX class F420-dependent oxidoreductase [Thermomicrobiaceae bacterium CFH 74404]|uniref:PPOX class F420-dependent oxidoreductase n=1 Tax=Thermalbibacter longus TaxID=2951981 RepID=A0AA41WD21_9BACT|nr:PPOX class F420-dependent oxidoreductase [Thermalbibacter longus]MCM8750657.1 PPOX class F420-dependent oxidoreductase [Thermalbibacter longus]
MLSPAIRAFLAEPRLAVLATINEDGSPQQTVMWYDLEGDAILMNTADGRVKVNNLRRNPRVSLCVEDGYRYVTISGRACQIEDQERAQADILRLAMRYHGAERARSIAEQFSGQHRITILVTIERVISAGF